MFDTALNNQFPAGAAAYAGYVDGGIGNQPNYAYIVTAFPKAQHLSIALFASDNADALDVEPGASVPSDIPGWYARQVARGIKRPVIYASVSAMNDDILPVLGQARIGRANIRLWTAHYGLGEHICGPASCGALSIDADGTQWTSSAMGLSSTSRCSWQLLRTTTTRPSRRPNCSQGSSTRHGAFTVIAVPPGTAHTSPSGRQHAQNVPVARLRVAFFDTAWHVHPDVVLDGTRAQHAFNNPSKTGVVSVRRNDAGTQAVGYVIY